MNAPQLMIKPSRDRKPLKLHCRFKIEAYPLPSRLDRARVRTAEEFVRDMHKQGWEHVERFGFTMTGPFPRVETVTIHPVSQLSAREMLPAVMQGNPLRDRGQDYASAVLPLGMNEYWEYDIVAVFQRPQMVIEYADLHEEARG